MTVAEFATALIFIGTMLMWAGFACAVLAIIGAFALLMELLTAETVEDATAATRMNRGGRAEPGSGRAIEQGHIAHDGSGR